MVNYAAARAELSERIVEALVRDKSVRELAFNPFQVYFGDSSNWSKEYDPFPPLPMAPSVGLLLAGIAFAGVTIKGFNLPHDHPSSR